MVELVSPSQAVVVRYSTAVQSFLDRCANIIGISAIRSIFFQSRRSLTGTYPWLAYVAIEEGIDFEIRSTLTSSTLRGTIEPDLLADGFRVLMQFMTKRAGELMGTGVVNKILANTRSEIHRRFPSTSYQIEWELLAA